MVHTVAFVVINHIALQASPRSPSTDTERAQTKDKKAVALPTSAAEQVARLAQCARWSVADSDELTLPRELADIGKHAPDFNDRNAKVSLCSPEPVLPGKLPQQPPDASQMV